MSATRETLLSYPRSPRQKQIELDHNLLLPPRVYKLYIDPKTSKKNKQKLIDTERARQARGDYSGITPRGGRYAQKTYQARAMAVKRSAFKHSADSLFKPPIKWKVTPLSTKNKSQTFKKKKPKRAYSKSPPSPFKRTTMENRSAETHRYI